MAISRARDGAELVTDNAWKLSDQLERATGERVAALVERTYSNEKGAVPSNFRESGVVLVQAIAGGKGVSWLEWTSRCLGSR